MYYNTILVGREVTTGKASTKRLAIFKVHSTLPSLGTAPTTLAREKPIGKSLKHNIPVLALTTGQGDADRIRPKEANGRGLWPRSGTTKPVSGAELRKSAG